MGVAQGHVQVGGAEELLHARHFFGLASFATCAKDSPSCSVGKTGRQMICGVHLPVGDRPRAKLAVDARGVHVDGVPVTVVGDPRIIVGFDPPAIDRALRNARLLR